MPTLLRKLALALLLLVCALHEGAARSLKGARAALQHSLREDCAESITLEDITFEAKTYCSALFDKHDGVSVKPFIRGKAQTLKSDGITELNNFCRCFEKDEKYKSIPEMLKRVKKSLRDLCGKGQVWDPDQKKCVFEDEGPLPFLEPPLPVTDGLKETGQEPEPEPSKEPVVRRQHGESSALQHPSSQPHKTDVADGKMRLGGDEMPAGEGDQVPSRGTAATTVEAEGRVEAEEAAKKQDPCTDAVKKGCKQANKQACKNGSAQCGDCLPKYALENGSCVEPNKCTANQQKRCAANNRGPCKPETRTAKCYGCVDGYHDENGYCKQNLDACTQKIKEKCEGELREGCVPGKTECGGCKSGYKQSSRSDKGCVDVCDNLAMGVCDTYQRKRCKPGTGSAKCGECLSGFHSESSSGECKRRYVRYNAQATTSISTKPKPVVCRLNKYGRLNKHGQELSDSRCELECKPTDVADGGTDEFGNYGQDVDKEQRTAWRRCISRNGEWKAFCWSKCGCGECERDWKTSKFTCN